MLILLDGQQFQTENQEILNVYQDYIILSKADNIIYNTFKTFYEHILINEDKYIINITRKRETALTKNIIKTFDKDMVTTYNELLIKYKNYMFLNGDKLVSCNRGCLDVSTISYYLFVYAPFMGERLLIIVKYILLYKLQNKQIDFL